jgi:hypothetical protein
VQLPCRVGDGRAYSEQNNADRILDTSRSENGREGTGQKELSAGERVLDEVEIVLSVRPFKLTQSRLGRVCQDQIRLQTKW